MSENKWLNWVYSNKKTLIFIVIGIIAVVALVFGMIYSIDYNARSGIIMKPSGNGEYFIVAGYSGKGQTSYKIPSTYSGKPVKEIADGAFKNCTKLESVEVPDSIELIGEGVFNGCKNLKSMVLPFIGREKDVERYGFLDYIFRDEVMVRSSIPDSLNFIKVTGGTIINEGALYGCQITSIELPETLTTIKAGAFRFCDSLESIELPEGLTTIEDFAFGYCNDLATIRIPESVKTMGESVFEDNNMIAVYCEATSKPSGWNTNWEPSTGHVIWNCNYNNKDKYGYEYGIVSRGIHYAVKGDTAKIVGAKIAESISPKDEIEYNSKKYPVVSVDDKAFYGRKNLTSVSLPSSIKSIGDYAFYDCDSLTSIEIPDSVASIGSYAFGECSGLNSVFVGENSKLEIISSNAFYCCIYLTRVYMPKTVKEIGEGAFCNCISLTSIEIPDSVISIGEGAFSSCSSLRSITLPFVGATKNGASNTHFGYIFGASFHDYTTSYVPKSLKTVKIIGGERIGDYAFYDCRNLTKVEIYNGITSIGSDAFEYCTSLTSIEIPNSVTSIGYRAFSGCNNLTISCEAASKPSGWNSYWNDSNCPVVWGFKG